MHYQGKSALLCGLLLTGSSAAFAQQSVPVRELTPVEAKTSTTFGNIFGVRPLADGGVLVNDGVRRQLVALDANLSNRRVVIDSAAEGGNSYGPRAAPLIPYVADSSLFVDGTSLTLLVIDPKGQVSHVIAAPKPSDMRFLAGGSSGIDTKGNLIYEGTTLVARRGSRPAPGQVLPPLVIPDSSPIVRANFETRTVDTLGMVKTQGGGTISIVRDDNGRSSSKRTINPLVAIDEWAVLADGSVAFLRGQDYHIDWIRPDGSRFSSPKLPFDWKRLTDDDKQRLVDSARAEIDRDRATTTTGGPGAAGGGGPERVRMSVSSGSGGGAGAGASISAGAPEPPAPVTMGTATVEFVPLKEIPDYYPPIRNGAAQADLDGNLWILPTTSAQSKAGELVYDVVNNKGELLQRVRLPLGRSIAGFAKGGVVYMMSRGSGGTWTLERARVASK